MAVGMINGTSALGRLQTFHVGRVEERVFVTNRRKVPSLKGLSVAAGFVAVGGRYTP
jgi:hypothetical protein